MTSTQKTNGDLEPREITALQKMYLSEKTLAIRAEVVQLKFERDTVLPKVQVLKIKTADLPLDAAVEKVLPLSLKAEIAAERLARAREQLFAAITEDAQTNKDDAEKACEDTRNAYLGSKDRWEESVRAAFTTRDTNRLIAGGAASNSGEVRESLANVRKASAAAGEAGSVQKMLCRDFWAAKVAAGLAASCGRPHVMAPAWYRRNATFVCPELAD